MGTWKHGNMGTWKQEYSLIPRLKYSLGMRLMLMQVEKLYVTHFVASHIKLSFLKLVGLRIKQQYKEIRPFVSMETENKQTHVSWVAYIRGSSWSK